LTVFLDLVLCFVVCENKFNVTNNYRDVINQGGWIKHLEYQNKLSTEKYEDKILDQASKQSAIDVNTLQKKVLLITVLGLISSTLIGLFGVFKEEKVIVIESIQIDSIHNNNSDTLKIQIRKPTVEIK
jgi:hypothetical protein